MDLPADEVVRDSNNFTVPAEAVEAFNLSRRTEKDSITRQWKRWEECAHMQDHELIAFLKKKAKSDEDKSLVYGGIPAILRPQVWSVLSRASQFANKYAGYYDFLVEEYAQKETKASVEIDKDVFRTFYDHPTISSQRPALRRLLVAYCWKSRATFRDFLERQKTRETFASDAEETDSDFTFVESPSGGGGGKSRTSSKPSSPNRSPSDSETEFDSFGKLGGSGSGGRTAVKHRNVYKTTEGFRKLSSKGQHGSTSPTLTAPSMPRFHHHKVYSEPMAGSSMIPPSLLEAPNKARGNLTPSAARTQMISSQLAFDSMPSDAQYFVKSPIHSPSGSREVSPIRGATVRSSEVSGEDPLLAPPHSLRSYHRSVAKSRDRTGSQQTLDHLDGNVLIIKKSSESDRMVNSIPLYSANTAAAGGGASGAGGLATSSAAGVGTPQATPTRRHNSAFGTDSATQKLLAKLEGAGGSGTRDRDGDSSGGELDLKSWTREGKRSRTALERGLFRNPQQTESTGYAQSMNYLGAILLLHFSEDEAFWVLSQIVESISPDYYSQNLMNSQVDQRVFKDLVARYLPDLAKHIDDLGFSLELFSIKWFLCVYADVLPSETTFRIWDIFLLERSTFILFRIGLGFLSLVKSTLMSCASAGELAVVLKLECQKMFDSDTLIRTAHLEIDVSKKKIAKLRKKHSREIQEMLEEMNSQKEMMDLQMNTHFGQEEIEKLRLQFRQLTSGREAGLIDLSTFKIIAGSVFPKWQGDEIFVERLYDAMDVDGDGQVDFRSLITALSSLCKGTPEEKLKMWFQTYDLHKSGAIEKRELVFMLNSMLKIFPPEQLAFHINPRRRRIRVRDSYFGSSGSGPSAPLEATAGGLDAHAPPSDSTPPTPPPDTNIIQVTTTTAAAGTPRQTGTTPRKGGVDFLNAPSEPKLGSELGGSGLRSTRHRLSVRQLPLFNPEEFATHLFDTMGLAPTARLRFEDFRQAALSNAYVMACLGALGGDLGSGHAQKADLNLLPEPPKFVNDDLVNNCYKCHAKFTIIKRKHHCRACGNVFCDDCCSTRTTIKHLGYDKPVRVCLDCLPKLPEFFETASRVYNKN